MAVRVVRGGVRSDEGDAGEVLDMEGVDVCLGAVGALRKGIAQ